MELQDLVGKTCVIIQNKSGDNYIRAYDEEFCMYFSDMTIVNFRHKQQCCENVRIAEIIGDPNDLIGRPLRLCEEAIAPGDLPNSTSTWYKFVTNEGSVTIRWLGESNGYYSEKVDYKIDKFKLSDLSNESLVIWDTVTKKLPKPLSENEVNITIVRQPLKN